MSAVNSESSASGAAPRSAARKRTSFLARLPGRIVNRTLRVFAAPLRRSRFTGVFHCTTQRTGSQWIKQIFADPLLKRFSGLSTWDYEAHLPGGIDPRPICERFIAAPFPAGAIATPLYIGYQAYLSIPKPGPVRAFFVVRDPRDLVVSEYFSLRNSHPPMGEISKIRDHLNAIDETTGMRFVMDDLSRYGTFACQKSWIDAKSDPNVLVVRFEDITSESGAADWHRILQHLDIRLPRLFLDKILEKYAFSKLAGRKRGVEDKNAHYRKGVQGDWKHYFDAPLCDRFTELTGNLVQSLGYEETRPA